MRIIKCFYFIVFYNLCILAISIIFKLAGFEHASTDDENDEEYPFLDSALKFFIMVMRISIGDIQLPISFFWVEMAHNEKEDSVLAHSMVYVIWLIWYITTILMCIVQLNFLIAYISQSFERVIDTQTSNTYL